MLISSFLSLTDHEKGLLNDSTQTLIGKLEILIERFYFYFLQSSEEVANLFKNTDMLKQQNMFNVAIGAIITNIDTPVLIQNSLDQYIQKHKLYGVEAKHVEFFIDSLTKAFSEILANDQETVKAWLKLFHGVMEYFRSEL